MMRVKYSYLELQPSQELQPGARLLRLEQMSKSKRMDWQAELEVKLINCRGCFSFNTFPCIWGFLGVLGFLGFSKKTLISNARNTR
jgi:hypothetical protein